MSSNARATALEIRPAPHAVEDATTRVETAGVAPARVVTEARISFLLHPSDLHTSPREGDPGESFLVLSPHLFTPVFVRCFVPCSAPVCCSPIAVVVAPDFVVLKGTSTASYQMKLVSAQIVHPKFVK